MNSQPTLVLDRVLRVMQPLVGLLLRNGVTFTVLSAALKRVFVLAAQQELARRDMPATDSAVTLLCGVHRRDVRELTRGALAPQSLQGDESAGSPPPPALPLGLAAQVVARWMNNPAFNDARGEPLPLPRTGAEKGFDALVAGISSDVRPRAVLEELLRLGVVREEEGLLALEGGGLAPRKGFEELSQLFADNLQDHAAASAANLLGEASFLEQAVFVDEITAASAEQLHKVAVRAWQQAAKSVLSEAQQRFDADALEAQPASRRHRARFGVYFYSAPEDPTP